MQLVLFRTFDWVTTNGSFGFAALLLAPLAVLKWPVVFPSAQSWIAVLLLAVLCTAIPNIYYFRLVQRVGPGKAMAVAFLIPAFGILWEALVLGEKVTPGMLGWMRSGFLAQCGLPAGPDAKKPAF